MYTSFENMPLSSRIWIYQADRELTILEQEQIISELKNFLENWTAHQQTLKASGKIEYNRFIIIAVDESVNLASGCSIDKQVHFIQKLESQLQVPFLDRSLIAFKSDNEIFTVRLPKIGEAVKNGQITPQTYTFNNAITNLESLNTTWLQPASETWLQRYFQKELV
ncbi:MAG: hypothetical protein MUC49_21650 [Raineya sp.]|jgi:hypothetical protein|nr:hypothetical protein [Raineya sp.]